jgi:tetratricopeptide (TPR) repeat protein
VDSSKLFLDQASQLFERAVTGVMKKCSLLYFTYADFEEQNMKFEKVHKIYQDFLAVQAADPTLAYVQYMKFCRRAEGIKAARTVFKMAREDERSNFHVYVAAALMEYYSSKDKNVAFRIFDLGLRKFSSSPEFILAYLDYLSHLNEDNNTRVLFERVLTAGTLEPRDSLEVDKSHVHIILTNLNLKVWNKFLEFETNIGDLASVVKVEKRRAGILEEAGLAVGENRHTIQVKGDMTREQFLVMEWFPGDRPVQVHEPAAPHPDRAAEHRLLLPLPGRRLWLRPPLLQARRRGRRQQRGRREPGRRAGGHRAWCSAAGHQPDGEPLHHTKNLLFMAFWGEIFCIAD